MHQKLLLTLLSVFLFTTGHAQKLSKNEKKIVKAIEQNNTEAISFLEKVVNINSGTLNLKGVEAVGKEFSN
ncbi:MAG TPA: M20 family peptidase, partial [Maribacter sp.]|nr:M20 family peptidase [Maribacter sp.]